MKKSHITAKGQLGLRELIAMGVGGMIGGGMRLPIERGFRQFMV